MKEQGMPFGLRLKDRTHPNPEHTAAVKAEQSTFIIHHRRSMIYAPSTEEMLAGRYDDRPVQEFGATTALQLLC